MGIIFTRNESQKGREWGVSFAGCTRPGGGLGPVPPLRLAHTHTSALLIPYFALYSPVGAY